MNQSSSLVRKVMNRFSTTETQRGITATKASFRSRVPLPASSCGERETRSAGEGRFPRLDLPSAAPSSAFGTFSPAKTAGEKDSQLTKPREPSKKNLRGAQNLWVSSTEATEKNLFELCVSVVGCFRYAAQEPTM